MRTIKSRMSYANVISTICLFLLLAGGTAYALTITSAQIKNGTIKSIDVKNNNLGVIDLSAAAEASLRQSPVSYVSVGGFSVLATSQASGIVSCPAGKVPVGGGANVSGGYADQTVLNGSFPYDSADADTIPDQWVVWVNNGSATSKTFTVFVACMKSSATTVSAS